MDHDSEEVYGYRAERLRLAQEWAANERALERLKELPVGDADPAALEARLQERQDEIEFEMGRIPTDESGEGG